MYAVANGKVGGNEALADGRSISRWMAVALVAIAPCVFADKANDRQFVKEAIEGNLGEQQLGELARQHGVSDSVKAFGATIITDHAVANQQAMALARKLELPPPNAVGPDKQKTYTELSNLSGAEFDAQFLRDMIEDHEKDIVEYESETQAKGAAADYARSILPTLRKHLAIAKQLLTIQEKPTGAVNPA